MERLLVLLLLATATSEFEFPEDPPLAEVTGPPSTAEPEIIDPDEDLVDPGEDGVSGRFFGIPGLKKLGSVASSLLNTIKSGDDDQKRFAAPAPPPQHQTVTTDYLEYDVVSDYMDSPVTEFGNIDCSQYRGQQRRQCRQARRNTRCPQPNLGASSGGPSRLALQQAQECCQYQQGGDLIHFNNCCQEFGFCPICEADTDALAEAQCCPLKYSGDELGYRRCCSQFGMCPFCDEPPEPPKPAGCMYKGKLFAPNSEMDKLAYKCMFVRCNDAGNGPETVLEYLDMVGCCEQGKDLFPPGRSIEVDECTSRVCQDGQWVDASNGLADVFASRCPDGWLDLGGSCIYIWKELMTWKDANAACGRLLAKLALPQNQAQLSQLINAFSSMEERNSEEVLGGWVDARDSGRQWQTSDGDTLTFQPWEEGSPDDRRYTACAGLTVTSRSQGWRDYLCNSRQNMMYPICQVPKKGCGQNNGGCGPFEGDMMFPPDSEIASFSDQCQTFRCTADSYVIREVNSECCYHHEWNSRAFGRARGWYTGLHPPGGFQLFDGLLCECEAGVSDCTQFFDY
ncbi:uncharacterized protein LOC119094886 isoform X2 [Pollicipes pollicipes]|uniref:uncharacterized protein LOC119094886 isoform X2 n=1 Tax=Pollicipes pollicipes TaxID=41117 RepID=UPI001884F4BC|nr:uncharacterized protein LOC119094886 isoform X2 [Pollicipes pollicipes]